MSEGILMPTKEELLAHIAEQHRMDDVAAALSEAERNHICDMGYYNNAIRGYMIQAMRFADFSEEDIARAVRSLWSAFDAIDAARAAEIAADFS